METTVNYTSTKQSGFGTGYVKNKSMEQIIEIYQKIIQKNGWKFLWCKGNQNYLIIIDYR